MIDYIRSFWVSEAKESTTSSSSTTLALSGEEVTAETILKNAETVERLYLSNIIISDEVIEAITNLKGLKAICINSCYELTTEKLNTIIMEKKSALECFTIRNVMDVDDTFYSAFKGTDCLKYFEVSRLSTSMMSDRLTDFIYNSGRHLSKLHVYINYFSFTNIEAPLGNLEDLAFGNLEHMDISWIAKICPKLTRFHTWNSKIGAQINSIKMLDELITQQSIYDDEKTLSSLTLKSIKLLKISHCQYKDGKPVSLSDLVPFSKKYPEAKIIFQSGEEKITTVPKNTHPSLFEEYGKMKLNAISMSGIESPLTSAVNVHHLELNEIAISEKIMALLGEMKNIESLRLVNCLEMNNEKLGKISEELGSTLKSIAIINNSDIEWEWVNNLLPLEKIEEVEVAGIKNSSWISSPEFSFLMGKGEKLKKYRLGDQHVGMVFSEVGATPSIILKNLEDLCHTELNDTQFEWLAKKAPELKRIKTSGFGQVGKGLVTMLSTLKKLEKVEISAMMALDTSIFPELAKLSRLSLRKFVINNCTDQSENRIKLEGLVPFLENQPQIQLTYFSYSS